jgi:hypothetical protein
MKVSKCILTVNGCILTVNGVIDLWIINIEGLLYYFCLTIDLAINMPGVLGTPKAIDVSKFNYQHFGVDPLKKHRVPTCAFCIFRVCDAARQW